MKRFVGLVGVFSAALTAFITPAPAQSADAAVSVKIGFVNSLAILQGTEEGKQQIAQFEQVNAEKQRAFDAQAGELQKLRSQYESQARVLNPATAAEMQRTIQEREKQLTRLKEDTEMDINQRRNELLGQMSEKIQIVITEYAEQNGYSAIFILDPSLPFVSPSIDLTEEIITLYNSKNPVAAPSASPTPPANPTP